MKRIGAALHAISGGEPVPTPGSLALTYAADAVLVKRSFFRFHVVKDRYGRAGEELSLLGVAGLRGRRRIVILDAVDRVIACTS
jgi:hypothetical protein